MLRTLISSGLVALSGCSALEYESKDKNEAKPAESAELPKPDDSGLCDYGWDIKDGSCVHVEKATCEEGHAIGKYETGAACTEALVAADPDAENQPSWVPTDGVCLKVPPSKAADAFVNKAQCEAQLDQELTLYGPCGEGVATFVPDLDAALDGKTCFISPPDVVTLDKWDNPDGLKTCGELGLDPKSPAVCNQKGLKCYADDEQATTCSDESTQGTKVTFRRTYTCDHYEEAVGCAASSRTKKDGIHYLGSSERAALAAEILSVKPATYVYKPEARQPGGLQLGLIIEDQPGASALVTPSRQSVDLYKYLTALVVTVQEQQVEIEMLKRALEKSAAGGRP